ncbi:hypothetical protein NBM05_04235 [Rothia sp. AR01]|uniref:Uncharacterized protein n=1 Tax=Rothia santali TaxID=2949643 RepID=A0A9X2HBV1_9MICC|nr:hypothetical protein [Rothia santali]MCP3425255.1 hypothetical protein [Rothia santali]
MSPLVSGLLLMAVGAFFAGGAISFRRQRLPVVVQVILWVIAVALFVYGGYVVTLG